MSIQPGIDLNQISDLPTRENFRKIKEFFASEVPFLGFKLMEVAFATAQSHRKISHGLGYQPKDILVTSQIGSGTVTFNQDLTSPTELDVTASGPVTVRFLVGTFGS